MAGFNRNYLGNLIFFGFLTPSINISWDQHGKMSHLIQVDMIFEKGTDMIYMC